MIRFYSLDESHRIYPIRGLLGYFHLLYDASNRESVLIDVGLVGEMARLSRVLKEVGLDWPDIKAILLTHGHIDHTGNLARIKQQPVLHCLLIRGSSPISTERSPTAAPAACAERSKP